MQGIFTISLDFELHWGGFEKWPLDRYKIYFENTRRVIPQMIELFRQHEVHVTWATVGMLFHRERASLMEDSPALRPGYNQRELSAYNFIGQTGIGASEAEDPFHYGGSLVAQILATPFQELGSHTFSHYYCQEPGQTVDQFRADLRSAQQSARRYGKTLRSLVFPRNQFNDAYLRVCYEEGFRAVRDNPRDWFWNIRSTQRESMWKRLNRGADAYLPVGQKNTYRLDSIAVDPGLPLCLPASRLLRPYHPSERFLNSMKINRIRQEMERAAKRGEVYHLWWHPHNFGSFPEQSLAGLRQILDHFDHCRKHYAMESLSMGETADLILRPHEKAPAA
jgi:peptidoglycan/xylan/chitin deacetylase (PgdA/CDA1 family)